MSKPFGFLFGGDWAEVGCIGVERVGSGGKLSELCPGISPPLSIQNRMGREGGDEG